jgi:hypothetical protein
MSGAETSHGQLNPITDQEQGLKKKRESVTADLRLTRMDHGLFHALDLNGK